jgi:caffeoyl-CoA O-methyltransferase
VSTKSIGLSDVVHDYLVKVSVREHPVQVELRAETASLPLSRMQISPEQGQFLALLAELVGARRALEIGVFTGYSALSVALALPPGGKLVACDVNEEWTSIARRHWERAGVADRIELRLAPAAETLDRLIADGQAESFDLAFIDADKTSYDLYYEKCLVLLRPGGLVAIDNALWSGDVADESVQDADTIALRALNAKVGRDPRVTPSLVPIGDGVLMARKR